MTRRRPHIAFVHQGTELYGSDRCLIETVAAIAAGEPDAEIEAVIPDAGPIAVPLARAGADVVLERLWVLRRRHVAELATLGALRFLPALYRAIRRFRRADLVYVNTVVVIDHLVAARFFPGKAIVHVHEAPTGTARRVLKALLGWSRAELVFNSRASEAAFGFGEERQSHVVYNGVADPGGVTPSRYDGSRPLRLLMIGRISRNKGQDVLIAALGLLPLSVRDRIEVRIVGSAFHDDDLEREIAGAVREAGLVSTVSLLPFTATPDAQFRWADLVVVPTKITESLGRVAIEAMAHGRPALVSALGGLLEVVEPGRTGWTVPPGDPSALSGRLVRIVERPEEWRDFGAAARERYERVFSDRISAERLRQIVRGRIGPSPAAADAAPLVEA